MRNWPLVVILVSSLVLMAVLQPANADYGIGGQGGGDTNPLATAITTCTTINSPGVYELQNDILNSAAASSCIWIATSNVIFDGMGHTIDGIRSSANGIHIYKMGGGAITNVTVKNVTLTDWSRGINSQYLSNSRIENVVANSNVNNGMYVAVNCANNVLVNNVINSNNGVGLDFSCTGSTLTNNTVNSNQVGFYVTSPNNFLNNNTAIGNAQYDAYASYTLVFYNNLNVGSANVSFVGNGVYLKGTTAPAGTPPMPSLGKYVSLSSAWPGAIIDLNISYTDADVANAGIGNENSLKMARYDGTWYTNPATFATAYGVDATNNQVYVSLTTPSGTYGPLGTSGQITGCTTINSPGEYKLAQDIIDSSASTCIYITSSNVVVDGQGHTIDGVDLPSMQNGIRTPTPGRPPVPLTNITIKNVILTDWSRGIDLENTQNTNLMNITGTSNGDTALWVQYGSNCNITGNVLKSNGHGIAFWSSSNANITNNTITSNANGIILAHGTNSIIEDNVITSNGDIGLDITADSDSNLVVDNTITSNGQGIELVSLADNNTITGNLIKSNTVLGFNIWLMNSYAPQRVNNIYNNDITSNKAGFQIYQANNVTIKNNRIDSNADFGVDLIEAYGNSISDNTITGGSFGVKLSPSYFGTRNNTISSNTIAEVTAGIILNGTTVQNNYITSNNITTIESTGTLGIKLTGSATGNIVNDNTVFGKGYGTGFLIDGANSNTLSNNIVVGAQYVAYPGVVNGIVVQNANYNKILGAYLDRTSAYQVLLNNSNFTEISGLSTQGSGTGPTLISSSNNNISGGGAIIVAQGPGIKLLSNSNSNTLSNVNCVDSVNTGPAYGLYISGSNDNLIQNSIAGAYAYYGDAWGAAIFNSVGNKLDNNQLGGSGGGAHLLLSNSNYTIVNNTKRAAYYSYETSPLFFIKLVSSHYNTIDKTDIGQSYAAGQMGLRLDDSTNNVILHTTSTGGEYPDWVAYFYQSPHNVVDSMSSLSIKHGVGIVNSQDVTLRNSNLGATDGYSAYWFMQGYGLYLYNSNNLNITNNNVAGFCTDALLSNADNNLFYNNNFTYAVSSKYSACPADSGTGILSRDGSTDNIFDQNNIQQNEHKGLWLKEAALITVNAALSGNSFVGVSDSDECLKKDNVQGTSSVGDTFTSCGTGINSSSSANDPIAFDTFKDGIIGIQFNAVTNSQVHDNNFINVVRPIVLSGTSGNTFTSNTGTGNGIAITGQTSADTFTNNNVGEIPATTVSCGQTLTTSTKMANSLNCARDGVKLSGNNLFLECNGKILTGIRNPTTQQLRGTGVTMQGSNDIVDGCNITGFVLAVDLGANPNVMSNDNLNKNAKGVSFVEYLQQTFANIDWDP